MLVLVASTAHAQDRLDNRTTMNIGFGLLAMQVDRTTTTGMLVQPSLTRTFDRFELQADYLLGDLRDDSMQMPGATIHRVGFAARYQAARLRDRGTAALELVVEAGIGLQYLALDDGTAFGRNDLEVGVGLRGLFGLPGKSSALMGLEMMFRGLVTPEGDKAVVFVFGASFGR